MLKVISIYLELPLPLLSSQEYVQEQVTLYNVQTVVQIMVHATQLQEYALAILDFKVLIVVKLIFNV